VPALVVGACLAAGAVVGCPVAGCRILSWFGFRRSDFPGLSIPFSFFASFLYIFLLFFFGELVLVFILSSIHDRGYLWLLVPAYGFSRQCRGLIPEFLLYIFLYIYPVQPHEGP